MAHIHANRVRDTSTTTGTGAFALSGSPPTGYQTFSSRMSVGDTCLYVIQHRTQNEWEVGVGEYTATNELTRRFILASSNSDAAVSFAAGTKDVAITSPARAELELRVEYTASHQADMGDFFKMVEMNVSSGNNFTVPPNSTTAFPLDTRIDVLQIGTGQTTIVAGSGVTINSKSGNLKLAAQWSAATLIKRGTNTWVLIGDLSA